MLEWLNWWEDLVAYRKCVDISTIEQRMDLNEILRDVKRLRVTCLARYGAAYGYWVLGTMNVGSLSRP